MAPTSQAAESKMAVLQRTTSMKRSTVISRSLVQTSCSTSPSAMIVVASASTLRMRRSPSVTIRENDLEKRKSPTSTEASFPQSVLAEAMPRRRLALSTTSSWSSVAVWMNSTTLASGTVRLP